MGYIGAPSLFYRMIITFVPYKINKRLDKSTQIRYNYHNISIWAVRNHPAPAKNAKIKTREESAMGHCAHFFARK